MTSLPILTAVMKSQNDYLNFSQKQREAQKAYFAQSPQLLSWDSNPGEGDSQTQEETSSQIYMSTLYP